MKGFYIPKEITGDYKYIVPSSNYYDLYNTNYLNNNSTYTYYRFYYNLEDDLYLTLTRNTNNYDYGFLNCIEVVPKNDYIYRRDYTNILFCSATLILFIVVLFNLITSLIKRGGLLSGLL